MSCVPALAAPPSTLPETRLRDSAVPDWPRYRPASADVADSIRENSHSYDGLASGSIYFLSRDPAVAVTRSPYGYVDGNPLNEADPSGLCGWAPWDWSDCHDVRGGVIHAAKTVVTDAVTVVSVAPYAVYYGAYQAANGINWVGSHLGTPGSVISHIVALPLTIPEGIGLGQDIGIDWIKQRLGDTKPLNDEGVCGGVLPGFILGGGPQTYLPGWRRDGGVDFAW